jgi:hypothetical protein
LPIFWALKTRFTQPHALQIGSHKPHLLIALTCQALPVSGLRLACQNPLSEDARPPGEGRSENFLPSTSETPSKKAYGSLENHHRLLLTHPPLLTHQQGDVFYTPSISCLNRVM